MLSNPADATIAIGTNTVSITDDDGSTLSLTTNAVTVAETNTSVTLTVVRSGATNTAVAVDFATTNGTATAGNDYTATNGTFSFAPGEVSNTVTITLTDDLLYEGNETFRVVLSGITNSTLSIGTNTITITDDDLAYLGFTASSASVNELDGTIDLTVERTGATNTSVSAVFFTTNLSATAGSDYLATNGVVSFAPSETNQTITVTILFDALIETNQTFLVRLVSLTNTAPATDTNITVTITDAFGGAPPPGEVVAIRAIQVVGRNELRLRISGADGAGVVLEATTDFQTWAPVVTNVLSGGTLEWHTPFDPTAPARFFRVVPPK